jgi:hypothetical protein
MQNDSTPKPPSTPDIIQEAHRLRERGYAIAWLDRTTKRPYRKDWTRESSELCDYAPEDGLGLMCGRLSGDLVCVDIDSPEALAKADEFLPPTPMVDGRPGKPRSHRWYKVANVPPELTAGPDVAGGIGGPKIQHLTGCLDIIGTGGQAVIPPSRHHSGECRSWDVPNAEPAVVDCTTLYGAAWRLAAACGAKPTKPVPAKPATPPTNCTAQEHRVFLPGVEAVPVFERLLRAEQYFLYVDPAIQGQHGHDRAYRASCLLVIDFAVPVADAKAVLDSWNEKCVPPWKPHELAELHRKLEEADKRTDPRGAKLLERLGDFANHTVTIRKENGRLVKVTRGRPLPELTADLFRRTDGWPKRVGEQLFARDGDEARWLGNPAKLVSWIGGQLPQGSGIAWAKGPTCHSKEELFADLGHAAEAFDSLETMPHEPPMPGLYYLHPAAQGGDGSALAKLLAFFSPATGEDAVLLRALFLSAFWGGPCGQRPAWIITSDEDGTGAKDAGRGVGKTTVATMLGRLAGGLMEFDRGESAEVMKQRLLSPDGRGKRLALLDNLKSLSFSWATLEGFITADSISGKAMYVGEASRPNVLTWVLTINGASLSKDLALRVIPLRLTRPSYDPDWESKVTAFIAGNRWRIIGDIVAALRQPVAPVQAATRWARWEQEVLARAAGERVADCQALIRERQAAVDDADQEADLVREAFARLLYHNGHNPAKDKVTIPSQSAVSTANEGLREGWTATKAVTYLKSVGIPELKHTKTKTRNVFVWTGKDAPANATAKPLVDCEAERKAAAKD